MVMVDAESTVVVDLSVSPQLQRFSSSAPVLSPPSHYHLRYQQLRKLLQTKCCTYSNETFLTTGLGIQNR